jgi:signal transduction histidine kinase/CheY-like chemotaxis protein
MPADRGPLRRYGFALGAVLCAALLTKLFRQHLEPTPNILFIAATLLSAWYGGVGPGLLTILLMGPAIAVVAGPQPPPDPARTVGFVLFSVITAVIGWQSTASRRARAALRLLADAGKSLAASLDYQPTLSTTARLAVPELAEGCLVDLLGEDGGLSCAAAAHADPVLENKLRLAAQCQAPSAAARRGVAAVVRSGQAVVYRRLSQSLLKELVPEEPRRQALRSLGVRSLLIVPLRAHGRTIGALTLLSSRWAQRYHRAAIAIAGELGQRAGLAIDNARLYRKARDMEEALRHRAEQLAVADRHKDEFLAVVAHELRGPLAALRSALEVVRLYGPGAPLTDAPQGIMTRQVDTLARLVDDLLDIARITQGKLGLRRQSLDLAEVLHTAVGTTRPLLDARRHTLTVTLPRESPRIDGDPVRLEQVFVNLLTNAAKYTESGGHVWLSAAVEEGADGPAWAVVSVRDSGAGMTPELLARAFDLFTQGPEAEQRSPGGLGIGLALVRRLVDFHGGSVEAHSDGPGRGSEFVVHLPLSTAGAAPVVVTEPPRSAPSPAHNILVVDDNLDAAESLALLLRLRGHDVRIAADGATALVLVKDYAPDVVLLDLGLPGMHGHEVCQRLRQQPGLDRALVVALTGSADEEDRRRSHEAGFDHHLVKPVDPDDLDRLLGGR